MWRSKRRPLRRHRGPKTEDHRPRLEPGDGRQRPTAHAEVVAIPKCKALKTFQLTGCGEIYIANLPGVPDGAVDWADRINSIT